jgi:hypothetical protein
MLGNQAVSAPRKAAVTCTFKLYNGTVFMIASCSTVTGIGYESLNYEGNSVI